MLAYYGTRISAHMTDTPEGYLICHDVPIARTGEMTYQASELQLDGSPDRLVRVKRYAEDVFEAAAVASFEGKEVTSGHPPESVGPANYAAYAKGHVQNVRRDLHIKDAALISDIKNRVVREVSCGYLCRYEPEGEGYRQRQIRGNHVAVVPRGRAGREVAIQDAAENAGKGKKYMSKFAEAILKAFGMAAREAESPEDVTALAATAATALDSGPARAEAPARETESAVPALDAALRELGEKLDCLIGLAEAKDSREEPDSEKALDALLENLEGGQAGTIPEKGDEETGEPLSGEAADAALAILRKVRPAVAAIEDRAVRAQVADALLNAVKSTDQTADIVRAVQRNAQAAAAVGETDFDKLCAAQKAAYDARNPHKKKEAK